MTNPLDRVKRVFFLIDDCSALKRLVRKEAGSPEGAPSVYLPWLGYRQYGYEVDIFTVGKFPRKGITDFEGCTIHIVPRPMLQRVLAKIRSNNIRMLLRTVFENIALYRAGSQVAETRPPSVVYSLRPMLMHAAQRLAKRYDACLISRIYGTLLYPELTQGPRQRPLLEHLVEKRSWQRQADATIITNDGTNGDKVADLLGVSKDQYHLWYNGVDKTNRVASGAAASFRSRIGLSEEHFVLLCLSRLEGWKRQDRIVRSLAHVLSDVPGARLVIAGDGRKRKSLERTAAKLDLSAYVTFLGAVPHGEVKTVMSAADVFLQMNDYSNLGNTLLEAMACGRTIVTWDVGTTSQVIQDYQTGRLLSDPEPLTIATAVVELANDPDLSKRLGENARRFAEERLPSWEDRVQMEINLVEALCARRQGTERTP